MLITKLLQLAAQGNRKALEALHAHVESAVGVHQVVPMATRDERAVIDRYIKLHDDLRGVWQGEVTDLEAVELEIVALDALAMGHFLGSDALEAMKQPSVKTYTVVYQKIVMGVLLELEPAKQKLLDILRAARPGVEIVAFDGGKSHGYQYADTSADGATYVGYVLESVLDDTALLDKTLEDVRRYSSYSRWQK